MTSTEPDAELDPTGGLDVSASHASAWLKAATKVRAEMDSAWARAEGESPVGSIVDTEIGPEELRRLLSPVANDDLALDDLVDTLLARITALAEAYLKALDSTGPQLLKFDALLEEARAAAERDAEKAEVLLKIADRVAGEPRAELVRKAGLPENQSNRLLDFAGKGVSVS